MTQTKSAHTGLPAQAEAHRNPQAPSAVSAEAGQTQNDAPVSAAPQRLTMMAPDPDLPRPASALATGSDSLEFSRVLSGTDTTMRDDARYRQIALDIVSVSGTDGATAFRLTPSQFGALDVRLAHTADGLTIHMNTEHEPGRGLLSQYQPMLVSDIRAQGVRVADAQVGTGSDWQSSPHQARHGPVKTVEVARADQGEQRATTISQPSGLFA
jgi:flagellar hook-length control protein FliK